MRAEPGSPAYLHGDEVDFAEDVDVDRPKLGDRPDSSRIQWFQGFPAVPVGVAATGPKIMSVAARLADRIDPMLGASAERIEWDMNLACLSAVLSWSIWARMCPDTMGTNIG